MMAGRRRREGEQQKLREGEDIIVGEMYEIAKEKWSQDVVQVKQMH